MARNTTQITPSTGDAAMRAIKDFWTSTGITGGGWTVIASGDGDALYNAAGDVITADSGAGSFANYTVGTKNAWCRIRMNGSTRELLLIRGATSTAWWIEYSLLGFSGGSPSATVPPTATDQQNLHGTALTGTQLFPTDGTYQLSLCADDAAPYYTGASVRLTGGTPSAQSIFAVVPLVTGTYPTAPTADADPYVCFAFYLNPVTYGYFTPTYNTAVKAWARPGLGGATWATGLLNLDANNSAGSLHGISSQELAPEVAVQMVGGPSWLGPSWLGPKGILDGVLQALTSTTVSPNGTHLVRGSNYYLRWGPLWLPWNATLPS